MRHFVGAVLPVGTWRAGKVEPVARLREGLQRAQVPVWPERCFRHRYSTWLAPPQAGDCVTAAPISGQAVARVIRSRAEAAGPPRLRIIGHRLPAGHASTAAMAGVGLGRRRDLPPLSTLVQNDPEDVRRSVPTSGAPGWLQQLADYVREAAASGQTDSAGHLSMADADAPAGGGGVGVSRSTISREIKAGEISAVMVGNRNSIPYEEFEQYSDHVMTDMVAVVADDIEADRFGDE